MPLPMACGWSQPSFKIPTHHQPGRVGHNSDRRTKVSAAKLKQESNNTFFLLSVMDSQLLHRGLRGGGGTSQ